MEGQVPVKEIRRRSLNWTEDSNDKDDYDWSEAYVNGQSLRFSFSSNSSASPTNQMEVDTGVEDWSPDQQDLLPEARENVVTNSQQQSETEFTYEFYLWNMDLEMKYHPKDFLSNQPQVLAENRSALIGWLSGVSRSFDFFSETLFLSVNVLDRFLSSTPITLECLQLVGLVALFVSAKELDVYHPTITELLIFATGNYTRKHFLQMEKIMLNQLGKVDAVRGRYINSQNYWEYLFHQIMSHLSKSGYCVRLVVPTCVVFLDYYVQSKSDRSKKPNLFIKKNVYDLTRNVLELCAQDYSLSRYAPSAMALGAMTVVEEFANGGPIDEPQIGHWESVIIKQCATDIWSYLGKTLTVPLSSLATEKFFYQYLTRSRHV